MCEREVWSDPYAHSSNLWLKLNVWLVRAVLSRCPLAHTHEDAWLKKSYCTIIFKPLITFKHFSWESTGLQAASREDHCTKESMTFINKDKQSKEHFFAE